MEFNKIDYILLNYNSNYISINYIKPAENEWN